MVMYNVRLALSAAAIAFLLLAGSLETAGAETATAKMSAPDGTSLGTVTLTQTPHGVLLKAQLTNLSPGGHGFHIHAKGSCSPDFKAAGGHYDPTGKAHGMTNPEGKHAGDLPNIYAASDGRVTAEVLNPNVTLGSGDTTLFDADGSSIIIHAKPDSHTADPGAGGRDACGVIEK